jgi:N-formylglutamate deformylase
VAEWFRARGHSAQINDPYQGGDIVARSGAPEHGRHSIQIEINRALYMDEAPATRGARFGEMQALCSAFLRDLAAHISRAAADSR